ncbi:zinc finger BED domain-containing protein 5 [Toxotes jaculatrix]|uniref:zinc finger BED domain-containing protein 5 n=1 Tax=Toxotes jaculatrix TaxID=941984 RepID=UPI001B3A8481|nr:zinc finger BED domain-containing protein 5 [Toxotes jaculatrix]
MDRFVRGLPTKRRAEDESSPTQSTTSKAKTRKYDEAYIALGFTSTTVGNKERPQCVMCLKILASDSLKPNKLRRHLETKHPEHKDKPVDFFKKKLINCRAQQSRFTKAASVPSNAQLVSYKVAYRVAQCKKPHTIAEELILPSAIDMVSTMIDEATASKLKAVPLSNNTIARRIYDLSKDIEEQLHDKVRESRRFALQMDEGTDPTKDCLLITYVRFIDADDLKEDLLFCKPLATRATADELFKVMDTYMKEADLKWEHCVGICTDGTQAMAGKRGGLQALIKRVSPSVQWTHCMIHREALASKQLSPELNDVMTDIIATVNYIKTRPVKARIFSALCEEMGSHHTAVLCHSEARWLSRGKVLSRIFELRDEIRTFLEEEGNELALKFNNNKFLMKVAYLSDMFQKLNELNLQMQGTNTYLPHLADKISSFTRKLEMWEQRVQEGNIDSFENLKSFIEVNKLENTVIPCMNAHISALQKHFQRYLPVQDPKLYDWIRDPFSATPPADFSPAEEEQFIDVTSDSTLRLQFQSKTLATFWIGVEKDYPLLGGRAVATLLPFATSYLFPDGVSDLNATVLENNVIKVTCGHSERFHGPQNIYRAQLHYGSDTLIYKENTECEFEFKDLSYSTSYTVEVTAFNGEYESKPNTVDVATLYNDRAVIGFLVFIITFSAVAVVLYKIYIKKRRTSRK